MASALESISQKLWVSGYPGMEIDLGEGAEPFSDEEFLDFCRRNPDARIERNSDGEIEIMAPAHTETGAINSSLSALVWLWAKKDGTGRAFESSTGFTLPNKALRSPDASWISDRRWSSLADEDRAGFARICPDFVIELRSQSDTLSIERKVPVYRPDKQTEILNDPPEVSAEPELPGFVLKLTEIWS